MNTFITPLQNDLFESAQIDGEHLRTFAQNEVRKKTNPIPQGICARRAQNRSIELRSFARERPSLGGEGGLFKASEDTLAALQVEERLLVEALTDLNMELTGLNAELAPWYEVSRAAAEWHSEMVEQQGFQLGGDQAAGRRQWVKTLDAIRQSLADVFREAGETRGKVRAAENKLRSVQAEIRIVAGKQKRRKG